MCGSNLGDYGVSTNCLQSDISDVSGGGVGRYDTIPSILNGNLMSSFGKNTVWCSSPGFLARNLGHSLTSRPARRSMNGGIILISIDFIWRAL